MVNGGIAFGENDNKFVFKLNPLSKVRQNLKNLFIFLPTDSYVLYDVC